jgi:hypothetical protein
LILSPFGKQGSLSFESPHPRMICARSVQNWTSGSSGEEVENVKVYRDRQRVVKKAHLSFQLRRAKNLSRRWEFRKLLKKYSRYHPTYNFQHAKCNLFMLTCQMNMLMCKKNTQYVHLAC